MICCLCGDRIRVRDTCLEVIQYKFVWNKNLKKYVKVVLQMEDGSRKKKMHSTCPVELGAPLGLIGADGEREDV